MQYLQQDCSVVFTAEQLTELLNIAGALGKLATAKWLRRQGAQWPTVLKHSNYYDHWQGQWFCEALDWARAKGCTSPVE
eukprot:18803-Heterococcus_DN1.PRE.3